MIKEIHPDLKPLSAHLKRLDVGFLLFQREYKYILEENNYDNLWKTYKSEFNKSKSVYSIEIDFEEYTKILIICINEIYNHYLSSRDENYIGHFNDFFCISIVYIIQNSKNKDFSKIIEVLKELSIVEIETIQEIENEIKLKNNIAPQEEKIISRHIKNESEKKYQIFISSTYVDLIEERQACVQAILKKGHIPAGMELFTAGDKSQWEVIKNWIDESDIYLLILGGRYGSIDKESGVSYTEMEYNYAVEKKKPIFSLVLSDTILDNKPMNIIKDYDHKNSKYIDFKKNVTSKICSFPENIDQIKSEVNHSLDNLISEYKNVMRGWIKGN